MLGGGCFWYFSGGGGAGPPGGWPGPLGGWPGPPAPPGLRLWLYGYKKIRNFTQIPKIGSKLSDKMHLKGDISKKSKFLDFGLCQKAVFWKSTWNYGFFDTHKVIFWEEKNSDLIKWYWSKKIHKNQSRAETIQNIEKRLFYFSLRFPTRIHFWVSKMQNIKKSKITPPYCASKFPRRMVNQYILSLTPELD